MTTALHSNDQLSLIINQKSKEKQYWQEVFSDDFKLSSFSQGGLRDSENQLTDTVFEFDPSLFSGLMNLSKGDDGRLFMILSAGLSFILVRYLGERSVSFAYPVSKSARNQFTQELVLANHIDQDESFRMLLNATKSILQANAEHQSFPLQFFANGFRDDNSFEKFYDIVISYKNLHGSYFENAADVNLLFQFEKQNDTLIGKLRYNTELFTKTFIDRLIQNYFEGLSQGMKNLDTPLKSISIVSKQEENILLNEFNATEAEFDLETNFHEKFEAHARLTPEKTAVVHNGESLSYQELNDSANRLHHYIETLTIEPGEVVALLLPRGIKLLSAIVGILKGGRAYLAIDTDTPVERIAEVLSNSGAKLLISANTFERVVDKTKAVAAHGFEVLLLDDQVSITRQLATYPTTNAGHHYSSDTLAYVVYTSGSTGKPKGAMVHQMGMLNHIYGLADFLELTKHDIIGQTASVSFDISVWQLLGPLVLGACTHIIDKEKLMAPKQFMDELQTGKVSIIELVPSVIQAFLEIVAGEENAQLDHVRWLLPTGEAISKDLAKRWYEYYPKVKLANAYGPAETSDDVTMFFVPPEELDAFHTIPIGKPLPNVHVLVLDDVNQLCPIGVKGEICIAGPAVGLGYLNNKDKTDEVFLPNPFGAQSTAHTFGSLEYSRIYKTGDSGYYRENGILEYAGRKDFQVKIRGQRIEIGEIEYAILTHSFIKDTVVTVCKDSADNQSLCAYYTCREQDQDVNLKDYLKEKLPPFMIPDIMMPLASFPYNKNGKIDRKALPQPDLLLTAKKIVPPENQVQSELIEIWSKVLKVEPQHIGITSSFFDLGGNSLSILMLHSRIVKKFDTDLGIVGLFQYTTIEEQAEYLNDKVVDEESVEDIDESLELMNNTLNLFMDAEE